MVANKNILIVAPAWIGDFIISQAVYKQLKNLNESCEIDLIIKGDLIPLAKMMPEIKNIYELTIPHGVLGLKKRIKLSQKLSNHKYNECFVLQNSFKSALIPWFLKIPIRVGYSTELRFLLLNRHYKLVKHQLSMVNRYLKLLDSQYSYNLKPQITIDSDCRIKTIKKFNLDNNKKNLFFCPDAEFGPAKRWPIEKWIELIAHLSINYPIYIVGKDPEMLKSFSSAFANHKNVHNLINRTSLQEVVNLLSCAAVVVSNDSGLMHIAASVNAKIISLFGSSSPDYTAPLIDDGDSKVIYKELSCSPCFERECPLKHLNCLNSITSENVIHEIDKIL
ncbi:MAG: lipopolysaccharide heptosyltransferase II [Gammaproteobacteria bacterium]|nr:lipopolysaccharide heptosyltransferase II [Gammaproteobacteria bacterium]|tara:strand:- start:26026 stop:27030 length:1005 start_codon:yes stop_codon:yes gene_type:complete